MLMLTDTVPQSDLAILPDVASAASPEHTPGAVTEDVPMLTMSQLMEDTPVLPAVSNARPILDPDHPDACYATTRDWLLEPLTSHAVTHLGASLRLLSPLTIGTACSGTDCAMDVMVDCAKGWPGFTATHVFSCESHPDKQDFIRTCLPDVDTLYPDATHLGCSRVGYTSYSLWVHCGVPLFCVFISPQFL